MNVYKITNISNFLGKRDVKYNTPIEINYVDGLTKNKIIIKVGDTVFLNTQSLPISVHKLRAQNLVTVVETNESEMIAAMQPKTRVKPHEEIIVEIIDLKSSKKKPKE